MTLAEHEIDEIADTLDAGFEAVRTVATERTYPDQKHEDYIYAIIEGSRLRMQVFFMGFKKLPAIDTLKLQDDIPYLSIVTSTTVDYIQTLAYMRKDPTVLQHLRLADIAESLCDITDVDMKDYFDRIEELTKDTRKDLLEKGLLVSYLQMLYVLNYLFKNADPWMYREDVSRDLMELSTQGQKARLDIVQKVISSKPDDSRD